MVELLVTSGPRGPADPTAGALHVQRMNVIVRSRFRAALTPRSRFGDAAETVS